MGNLVKNLNNDIFANMNNIEEEALWSMNQSDIQRIIEQHPDYKDKLFCRGFLFTDDVIDEEAYPFYGLWQQQKFGRYTLFVSSKQQYFQYEKENKTYILVGHAYDPIDMIADENEILKRLAEQANKGAFQRFFNQLTGIFTLICITEESVYLVGDATCMQTTFYGLLQNHLVISSHTNLIGDLYNLEWDSYVKELTHYRFFKLLGNSLPGDITQFKEVKRIVPNHYIQFNNQSITIKRFYTPRGKQLEKTQIVKQAGELLHSNLALITQKWQKPAISMTGGCDSKTTLACAKGLYDRFSYFSYISSDAEKVDADAAKAICKVLGLDHESYAISSNDDDYQKTEVMKAILFWNCGGILPSNPNDVRKRLHFLDTQDFDVEIKSWASEIGRSYYSKRFNGRTDFGNEPTPRKCTTLYKFFLNNRKLVKETDRVFKEDF